MTAVSDETGREWLWRVYNLGFPKGHEDSSNTWGSFQIISHDDAVRLAMNDDNGAYEFVPYQPAKPAALSAAPVGEPALRMCGYCKTWNSKPCGEQCYLQPSDPVWTAPVAQEPVATKKVYIKPLRTIVEIQTAYADQIRDWLNTSPPAASVEVEELKDFIQSASFSSRSADDGDTIFCQIYTPGYPPQHKGSFGFYVKDLRAILLLLTRGPDQGEVVQTSIATKQPTDPEIRSATETALTLDFVRLGVKAGLLMAAADCGNHAEGCMEDAMTSAGLAAHDKKMLDAECNAADAIQKQIKETCEDSALGYAAYMLPDEDQAALAVLGVTSDWLYRRTTGEPSRKELLDPVAPRAVADTRRAGSAGLSPRDGLSDPAQSSVEER